MNIRRGARAFAEVLAGALLDSVICDGCGSETFDPTPCDHLNELCPDCVAEGGKCRPCYLEARDEIGATW